MEQDPASQQQPEQEQPKAPQPVASEPAGARLFGRWAVAVASLVGTPVAGGIVLAVNGVRLGQKVGALIGLAMGVLLTYSLMGLVAYVPPHVPPVVVLLPIGAIIMAWVAGMLQGDVLKGRRGMAGWAGALVIGLVVAGGIYGVLRVAGPYFVKKQEQGASVPLASLVVAENQTMNYAPPVEEAEARRVGDVLKGVGFFDETKQPKQVVMVADGQGVRTVVFRIDPAHVNDPNVLKTFALVAKRMLEGGVRPPFVIRLADPQWKMLKDIRVQVTPATHPGTMPAGQGGEGAATTQPGLPGPFGQP